ncbi:MAG: hypothetical protein NC319_02095 [Butyricicoccus sp.]|nr:hypothetical protein [Butyricicoccus sp.]
MKSYRLRTMVFLALCCDLGLFSKRIIAPFANLITDALHIPGGIGTSFSLMFLVIAAAMTPHMFCGTIMGAVQSILALGFGMVGSMGALSPIGYIAPGIVIDLLFLFARNTPLPRREQIVLANAMAAACASLAANLIVFRLRGIVLLLYLCVSAVSGAMCGLLGDRVAERLEPVIGVRIQQDNQRKEEAAI